jgi:hypothetical protein
MFCFQLYCTIKGQSDSNERNDSMKKLLTHDDIRDAFVSTITDFVAALGMSLLTHVRPIA